MTEPHTFETFLHWPADAGQALPPAAEFTRNSVLSATGKADVPASAPTVFGGDAARYNPEELLLMSLSQCHMLTYLALAARRNVAVLAYDDRATGTLGVAAMRWPRPCWYRGLAITPSQIRSSATMTTEVPP